MNVFKRNSKNIQFKYRFAFIDTITNKIKSVPVVDNAIASVPNSIHIIRIIISIPFIIPFVNMKVLLLPIPLSAAFLV